MRRRQVAGYDAPRIGYAFLETRCRIGKANSVRLEAIELSGPAPWKKYSKNPSSTGCIGNWYARRGQWRPRLTLGAQSEGSSSFKGGRSRLHAAASISSSERAASVIRRSIALLAFSHAVSAVSSSGRQRGVGDCGTSETHVVRAALNITRSAGSPAASATGARSEGGHADCAISPRSWSFHPVRTRRRRDGPWHCARR